MKTKQEVSTAVKMPERFFRPLDWSAFWTAFVISFVVYFFTLAPTVTLEDSGELATASAYLGVPHPPGYPIWTVITWLFTKIFGFVRFRGQPNPAWAVGLASAVSGALATGFTAILICRSGTDMLRGIKRTTEIIGSKTEDLICWAAGVSASLIFAFSPVNWSQSVIVEVYSLNAFFLVLIMFLTYVWMRSPGERLPYITGLICFLGGISLLCMLGLTVRLIKVFPEDFLSVGIHYVLGMLLLITLIVAMVYIWRTNPNHRLLYLTALTFGLGLTNYQVLLLLLVPLVLVVLLKDLTLFRDFLAVGVPFVIVYLLIKKGILPPLKHPTDITCYAYIILALAFLVAMYFLLPNGKAVAPTVICLVLGLSVYIFMPLASETNPPMNWGYPRTWEGFQHAITRGQYERITPTPIFSKQFIRQVGDYLRDLRGTFTLPVALIGFLPFTAWSFAWKQRRIRVLSFSVIASVLAVGLIVIEEIIAPAVRQIALLSIPYRAIVACIMLTAAVGVIIIVLSELRELGTRLLIWLRRAPPQESIPSALEMDVDTISQKWTLVILSGFLVMSVVLVMLASPKGDIQDEFIQRVKFISSHALYAFWIGYGLLLSLAFVDTFVRGNRVIKWAGISATLLLPVLPVLENAYNPEAIRINGGAEQNGHDFGWQFGNYQLRGAKAIQKELSPDEEPLPNPEFPPEMGTNAIFFGGTDPGRFVPTYMIYSANVRPDVYLITQNALADNTYMSVMRDLYGDRIYIPSQEDSARAFQRYVEEVRAGKRPPNAELKIEGGRVQVSGALGVMEINGILAQMIFERNNYKHDFYVEESYVIAWMYPYLTPHGLIMKINPQPTPLTEEHVRNDQDFWDWYTRRLHGDNKFIRDVVARKSFSKLRSAIAGLYAQKGRPAEAENAFQQARILYPLSPEANFRLVQEVLIGQGRFAEAKAIMQEFALQDPGNDRVPEFINHLGRLEGLVQRTTELEAKRRTGQMDINSAFELAECYLQLQRRSDFRTMLEGILGATNLPAPFYYRAATLLRDAREWGPLLVRALDLCNTQLPQNSPPEVLINLARMYLESHHLDKAGELLQNYVRRAPTDWKACLDLAFIQLTLGHTNAAIQALVQARQYGGEEAFQIITQDDRFAPIRDRVLVPVRSLLGLPGVVPATPPPAPGIGYR